MAGERQRKTSSESAALAGLVSTLRQRNLFVGKTTKAKSGRVSTLPPLPKEWSYGKKDDLTMKQRI